jgi:hypothetical protein
MKIIHFLLACILFGLSACDKTEEVKTVDWYLSNLDAMKAKVSECRSNPGQLRGTPNCINAERADTREQASRTRLPKFEAMTAEDFKDLKRPEKTKEEIEAERAKDEEFKKRLLKPVPQVDPRKK